MRQDRTELGLHDAAATGNGAGEFAGAVAVVTGASSGIGQAIARELTIRGARVQTARRRPSEPESSPDPQIDVFKADLAEDRPLEDWIAHLLSTIDRADVLIHCAGAVSLGPIESAPASELDRLYRINVRMPYRLTQALLPMLRSSKGQIVFINSSVVFNPGADTIQYSSTKAALRAMADGLRQSVNRDGVRVLSVYPGRTATPMGADVVRAEGREWKPERLLQPADIAAAVVNALLLPRTAEITDLRIRPMQKYEI